jgi:predicted secreted protein
MPLRISPTIVAALALGLSAPAVAQEETTWSEIRSGVVGERPLREAEGLVVLEAPKRAEDAAIVPIGVRLSVPEGDSRRITRTRPRSSALSRSARAGRASICRPACG